MRAKIMAVPVAAALALGGWFALAASASDNAPAPSHHQAAPTTSGWQAGSGQAAPAPETETPPYKGDWHLVP